MTELLTVEEGIFGCFFMDTDILSTVYYDIHNQQQPIGDMPWVPQHTTASAWKRAVNKFVKETCDIIQGHYHCCIVKNGQIYPGCLQPHNYIDYAFPLLVDDPHTNRTLATRMATDVTMTVIYQQSQTSAPTTHPAPQTTEKEPTTAPPATQLRMQPVLETTSLDVIIEEEIVKIKDDSNMQDQAEEDKESAILSMIQVCQEANTPPEAPDTPCLTCATPGEASTGQLSMDTEMMTAVASLSLSSPAPVEAALSSEMSQQLGPAPGTLPNLEQNVQESTSPLKQVDLDCLRHKSR